MAAEAVETPRREREWSGERDTGLLPAAERDQRDDEPGRVIIAGAGRTTGGLARLVASPTVPPARERGLALALQPVWPRARPAAVASRALQRWLVDGYQDR
jgi:hypothetical protein